MKPISYAIVVVAAFAAVGCGAANVQTTANQEHTFRNPPKNPPAAAFQGMQQGMQAARKGAQQAQRNGAKGN